jgi:hypothetical protein
MFFHSSLSLAASTVFSGYGTIPHLRAVLLTDHLQGTQIIGYLDFGLDSPWNFISEVVVRTGRQMTGMYPTLIIVIVNFKRTIWEEYPVTTLGRGSSLKWAIDSGRSGATGVETRPDVGIQLDHLDTVSEAMRTNRGVYRRDKQLAGEEFSADDRVVVL